MTLQILRTIRAQEKKRADGGADKENSFAK